jgi:hypothetical protein
MLDTHEPGNDGAAGPVSTTNTLEPGRQYFAIVSGTYSLWGSSRWTSGGFLVCGTPEPTPMFVSPGTANGAVGADP